MPDWYHIPGPKSQQTEYLLELLLEGGEVDQSGKSFVKNLFGIRIRCPERPGGGKSPILNLTLTPRELPHPIEVDREGNLRGWGRSAMSLNGAEGYEELFLNLVEVKGWKLSLEQPGVGQQIRFKLVLRGQWLLDAPPHYFPGPQGGEVTIRSHTEEGEAIGGILISIPWPFTYDGKLMLYNPLRRRVEIPLEEEINPPGSDDTFAERVYWECGMQPAALSTILEAVGPVLRPLTMGLIDVKGLVQKVLSVLDLDNQLEKAKEFLYFITSTTENGDPEFELQLGTPGEVELAEFAGMRLMLLGKVALALQGVLNGPYLEQSFEFRIQGETAVSAPGLRLEGPLIRKFQDGLTAVRAVADMLPGGLNLPALPEIKFEYRFASLNPRPLEMGRFRLPARWDAPLPSLPLSSGLAFLKGLPLNLVDGALDSLAGFQLGTAAGANPGVELKILKAEQKQTENAIAIVLTMDLTLRVFGEEIKLNGTWEMQFDWETLAFDPMAGLHLESESTGFSIGDLHIEGLNTLSVEWKEGQLTLKATSLRAFYDGISDKNDDSRGFELLVTNLLIDSGGIDIDLELVGGTTTVRGVGESFKGAGGAISFRRSEFEYGYITAEGPLPWLDNATGSITLTFGRGFRLEGAQAEFQLGLHHKTDWWVEIDLQSVGIQLDLTGDEISLILMVTGKLGIAPPEGTGGIFKYFKEVELEFKDLVLTKAFDQLPSGLSLNVVLAKPFNLSFLGIFDFEIRSLGIGSGFDAGGAALSLGGQIFFSKKDLKNTDPEYHKFKIGSPDFGSFLPRFALENLPFDVSLKPTLHASGKVEFKDSPDWKGFIGNGTLTINGKIKINCLFEFSNKKRSEEEGGGMVRVWMVYAEWENFDTKLLGDFYLRDIGIGFGWRKTLTMLEEPEKLLTGSLELEKTMPHKPEAWIDDLSGDPARWTVLMSAWLTTRKKDRKKVSDLVGNILLALRSDLTVLLLVRGWIFNSLDTIKNGPEAGNPPVLGMVYYSPPAKHLIAALIVKPGTPPKGVPPAMVKALIGNPFTFILETKPGLFRLELGTPRQLSFPLGIWTGRAGFFINKAPGALTIGIGFEVAIDRSYNYSLDFGIGKLSIQISVYIAVWGLLAARIGSRPALYGEVGIYASANIDLNLRVEFSFKLFWKKITIRFSFGFSIEVIVSAMVAFGVSDAGFGIRGEAQASLRIWKFSFSASISFSMGTAALEEAHRRVFEGSSMAGEGLSEPLRYLPKPLFPVRTGDIEIPLDRFWSVLQCRIGKEVYVLLLPREGSWLATPEFEPPGEKPLTSEAREAFEVPYRSVGNQPDYEWHLELEGVHLQSHGAAEKNENGGKVVIRQKVDWNASVPASYDDTSDDLIVLGDMLYEGEAMWEEYDHLLRCFQAVVNDPSWKPELIEDERVRSGESAVDKEYAAGLRPDVRSPRFAKDTGYYDIALEEAFRYSQEETLSWPTMVIAYTDWTDGAIEILTSERETQEAREQSEEEYDGQLEPRRTDFLLNGEVLSESLSEKGKRLRVLRSIEDFEGRRSGILGNQIREYSKWVEANRRNVNSGSIGQGAQLEHMGLAFRFRIQPGREHDFRIEFKKGLVNGGTGREQVVREIENRTITATTPQLGFSRKDHSYRIVELQEFQDENGIHFSWIFEVITPGQAHVPMTHRESSGLYAENDWFEHFDHYRVERENLAGDNNDQNQVKTWAIRPAYVPAYVQTDVNEDGSLPNRKLFIVAPRFDFSDLFEEPTEIGAPLIYRITAIDLFGNPSQTMEWYTTRKALAPPPPPERGKLKYTVQLKPNASLESLSLHITENRNLHEWEGGPLRYEIWSRAFRLTASGFFGSGNDAEEVATGALQSSNSTEGMTLVVRLPEGVSVWEIEGTDTALTQLDYGMVHAFFVRAVSREGNASRLMRCEHYRGVGLWDDQQPKSTICGYLERIPPPASELPSWQWLSLEEIRSEVRRLLLPTLANAASPEFEMLPSPNPIEQELNLRILHQPTLDREGHHPTGGYEVLVRDMDSSIEDTLDHYQVQARLEVVSKYVYAFSPPDSGNPQQWEVPQSKAVSPDQQLVRLLWGQEGIPKMRSFLEPVDYLEGAPEGILVHPDLTVLLKKLQQKSEAAKWQLEYFGGLCNPSTLEIISFEAILERFGGEQDPSGSGLLKWLGRSVDLGLVGTDRRLGSLELAHDWIKSWLSQSELLYHTETDEDGDEYHFSANFGIYTVLLERLINSDRQTDMGYFRLSLLPRLEPIVISEDEDEDAVRKSMRRAELSAFIDCLNGLGNSGIQVAALDVNNQTLDQYHGLTEILYHRHQHQLGKALACDLSWFQDGGEMARPLNLDGTVSLQLRYQEPYAKRLAYRLLRISRYQPLYQRLGLVERAGSNLGESASLNIRLPRIKPPNPPTIQFLGNFNRNGILCSEWLIREHDEEMLVQSNETYRNRLGFRGIAWSLFCSVKEGWRRHSGWEESLSWSARPTIPDDNFLPGLSEAEIQMMNADAAWEGELALAPDAGLAGHPFTELLRPKGTLIRVPALPYYYSYRLGAFSRSDDVDSKAKLSDASPVFPVVLPQVDRETSGWKKVDDETLEVWWRIPSAWQSLSTAQQQFWAAEQPFADRLWDSDISFTLRVTMQGTQMTLAMVKPYAAGNGEALPDNVPLYQLTTPGKYLYVHQAKLEQEALYPASPFLPELRITLKATDAFKPLLRGEEEFLDLVCSRTYGLVRQTDPVALKRELPPIPTYHDSQAP